MKLRFISLASFLFIALTSLSYSAEFEESKQNTTAFILPFYSPYNISGDQKRLHPAKGETLWYEERPVKASYTDFKGNVNPFDYPKFTEITLSPLAVLSDLFPVLRGLKDFNDEKIGNLKEEILEVSLENFEKNPCIRGYLLQRTLYISSFKKELLKFPHPVIMSLLEKVHIAAKEKGVKTILVYAIPVHESSCNNLLQQVFTLVKDIVNLGTGEKESVYSREFPSFKDKPQNDHTFSPYSLSWKKAPDHMPNFKGCFGVFIRGRNGIPKGGVIGEIKKEAAIPYADVHVVWIKESLRGRKLGGKALLAAETFAKERGAGVSQLDTFDFQARGFYEKQGYTVFLTYKNAVKDLNGVWNNHYGLRKDLV